MQPGDGAREDRLRRQRQGRSALLKTEQTLLQRFRGGCNQGETTGAVDAAQRMTGADHRLGGSKGWIELQHLQLGVERREMLLRLFAKNPIESARQRDLPD